MNKTMRDTFFDSLYESMIENENIYLITADFGAPMLDKIRISFPQRSINVGIAEQNAVNVATGLALEGKIVYVYGIAPFISMRPFEQLRINLSALSSLRNLNVNIVSVGAGVSYSVSGPTHHCLEDLGIIKTLPNFEVFSPSDSSLVKTYFNYTINIKKPKYLRFDVHNLPNLKFKMDNFDDGFRILEGKNNIVLISTGYMSNKVFNLSKEFNITLIDMYSLTSYNKVKLFDYLQHFEHIITLEEGFINSGGLDSEINFNIKNKNIINMGFPKKYTFEIGNREQIHSLNGIGIIDIQEIIKDLIK